MYFAEDKTTFVGSDSPENTYLLYYTADTSWTSSSVLTSAHANARYAYIAAVNLYVSGNLTVWVDEITFTKASSSASSSAPLGTIAALDLGDGVCSIPYGWLACNG